MACYFNPYVVEVLLDECDRCLADVDQVEGEGALCSSCGNFLCDDCVTMTEEGLWYCVDCLVGGARKKRRTPPAHHRD